MQAITYSSEVRAVANTPVERISAVVVPLLRVRFDENVVVSVLIGADIISVCDAVIQVVWILV